MLNWDLTGPSMMDGGHSLTSLSYTLANSGLDLSAKGNKPTGLAAKTAPAGQGPKPVAYEPEPDIGDITPPNGIKELLPNKSNYGSGSSAITTYSNKGDKESIDIYADGSWYIIKEGKEAQSGKGQQSLNDAFEKAAPKRRARSLYQNV